MSEVFTFPIQQHQTTPARTTLNRLAAGGPATPVLGEDGLLHLVGSASALLTTLAHEAIHLFGGERRVRVKQCESETCARLFLDISRSGDRRWCSMSSCGNKAKVAEFRLRKKMTARPSP